MTSGEMSDVLKQLGWDAAELVRRLSVRPETVRAWLSGRREIPANLARWLLDVRDGLANVGPQPEGWTTASANARGRLLL